jgi:hypothetical protein
MKTFFLHISTDISLLNISVFSEITSLLCASEQMLQASQLYSLGLSSICIIEVETALLYYPSTKINNSA